MNTAEQLLSEARVLLYEEHKYHLQFMAENKDYGVPCVGLFWYNKSKKSLYAKPLLVVEPYDTPGLKNVGGEISCNETHKGLWRKFPVKEGYRTGKKVDPEKYKWIERGRVFYVPKEDKFIIKAGDWLEQHKKALELILETYNLKDQKVQVLKHHYWDLGQGYDN